MRPISQASSRAEPARGGKINRGGAVLVITLLALVLIASLVFFVMNLGRQAQQRIEAQDAADATAAAGAGWLARSFNDVAMNNVGIARMLSLVQVLDTMPRATHFTYKDQLAVQEATKQQLGRSVSDRWVREQLRDFLGDIKQEVTQLKPMDRLFNGQYDVRKMTFFRGPSGKGDIWRAMAAMDANSRATMANLDRLTHLNATKGGMAEMGDQSNVENSGGGQGDRPVAVLVPLNNDIPWKRGTFGDFKRPVMRGLLPRAIDDKVTNRGPYDVLFGYRDPVAGRTLGHDRGTRRTARDGRPDVPIGRGSGGDNFVQTGRRPDKYRTYGPVTHMIRALADMAKRDLPHSRFAQRVGDIAHVKLNYLWSGGELRQTIDPDWQTDFNAALALAQRDPSRIKETCFVAVEIKSRYQRTDPRFLTPGSWAPISEEHPAWPHGPRVVWGKGWLNPQTWGVRKVDNYIWRDEWSYSAYFDGDIGLFPTLQHGLPTPQPVYRIDEYVFVGVNTGNKVDVRNPNNFNSRQDLPAPYDFDPQMVTRDPDSTRKYLTVLGVVRKPNPALFWTGGFDHDRGDGGNVAIAQARVFNNHSWDLWTQMWFAQNQRVTDYSNWLYRFDKTVGTAHTPGVDPAAVAQLRTQLENASPLASVMLKH